MVATSSKKGGSEVIAPGPDGEVSYGFAQAYRSRHMNRETIVLIAASGCLGAVALAVALSAQRRLAVARRSLAVVRYDAFEDMGGRLSFSAALMDDHGSGLVLSAISGRMEARAYAKIIEEGESEMGLSPEERKAIDEAMTGSKRNRTKVKARR